MVKNLVAKKEVSRRLSQLRANRALQTKKVPLKVTPRKELREARANIVLRGRPSHRLILALILVLYRWRQCPLLLLRHLRHLNLRPARKLLKLNLRPQQILLAHLLHQNHRQKLPGSHHPHF
ncbi:MAG: hypothetical protein COA93_04745 [Alphaproteobacteria bacterium]|nr:MAG: hypothetical protein COA93_04745 [Alphaproteobacteria bacterium]